MASSETVTVTVELPREFVDVMNRSLPELAQDARRWLVLAVFRDGQISAGKAAEPNHQFPIANHKNRHCDITNHNDGQQRIGIARERLFLFSFPAYRKLFVALPCLPRFPAHLPSPAIGCCHRWQQTRRLLLRPQD